MFQAKYDYKQVKMEFGWHRKALDACMVGDLAKLKLVVKNRSKEVGYRVNINDVYDEDFEDDFEEVDVLQQKMGIMKF